MGSVRRQFAAMIIRDEQPGDAALIRKLVGEAFADAAHSSGTEGKIVDALREAGALAVSLVAIEDADIVGHVAISPVSTGGAVGWFGLGPVAVVPERQRGGIGSALIEETLARLRQRRAAGCVVLGDPHFYRKFGFSHDPKVTFAGAPPEYFLVLDFGNGRPSGSVEYHPAFDAKV